MHKNKPKFLKTQCRDSQRLQGGGCYNSSQNKSNRKINQTQPDLSEKVGITDSQQAFHSTQHYSSNVEITGSSGSFYLVQFQSVDEKYVNKIKAQAQEFFKRNQFIETGVLYRNLAKLLNQQIEEPKNSLRHQQQIEKLKLLLYGVYQDTIILYQTLGDHEEAQVFQNKANELFSDQSNQDLSIFKTKNELITNSNSNKANDLNLPVIKQNFNEEKFVINESERSQNENKLNQSQNEGEIQNQENLEELIQQKADNKDYMLKEEENILMSSDQLMFGTIDSLGTPFNNDQFLFIFF